MEEVTTMSSITPAQRLQKEVLDFLPDWYIMNLYDNRVVNRSSGDTVLEEQYDIEIDNCQATSCHWGLWKIPFNKRGVLLQESKDINLVIEKFGGWEVIKHRILRILEDKAEMLLDSAKKIRGSD